MPSKRRKWKFRIDHILEASRHIQEFTREMDYEQFRSDIKTIDAVVRNFIIIGEATRHVPDKIEADYPDVAWDDAGHAKYSGS